MRDRRATLAPEALPYQGKCLKWLRDDYAKLAAADRSRVDEILAGTGCERLFDASGA